MVKAKVARLRQEVGGDADKVRGRVRAAERAAQAGLNWGVFGNPFRVVSLRPAWRTSTAFGLARAIDDDRAYDRLPILADALEEAGCDDSDILNHCRGDGPHVRG